jgi:hypothetical protein
MQHDKPKKGDWALQQAFLEFGIDRWSQVRRYVKNHIRIRLPKSNIVGETFEVTEAFDDPTPQDTEGNRVLQKGYRLIDRVLILECGHKMEAHASNAKRNQTRIGCEGCWKKQLHLKIKEVKLKISKRAREIEVEYLQEQITKERSADGDHLSK